MKICPNCEAELKDSVIRCVRCGQTVRGDAERDAAQSSGAAPGPSSSRKLPPPASAKPGVWATGSDDATLAVSAPPTATATRSPERAWTPPAPLAPSHPPPPEMAARRALPKQRTWGPDPVMLLAGLAALGAGVMAFLAVKDPWVHLTVTRAATDFGPALVATLSLRGKAAFVGTAGTGLAIALAALGLAWFFYGFQRGWTIPGLINPGLGMLVTLAGLLAAGLAGMVWFVWQDAMVLRAKAAGLSVDAMRELVHLQPAPLVQITRLSGLMTFGGMMLVGLLASCLGWYAYRRRGG